MDQAVILFTGNGYAIDDGHGHLLYDGQTWKTLEEAEEFAKSEDIDYIVV